jgi:hypothetical protein
MQTAGCRRCEECGSGHSVIYSLAADTSEALGVLGYTRRDEKQIAGLHKVMLKAYLNIPPQGEEWGYEWHGYEHNAAYHKAVSLTAY